MIMPSASIQAKKNSIVSLLSDAEIGKVSMAETKKNLAEGDQFVDLDNLDAGVQIAKAGGALVIDDIIPRSAIGPETWDRIVQRLKAA
jgi:hypothetical protein